jgi:hypothetical protein
LPAETGSEPLDNLEEAAPDEITGIIEEEQGGIGSEQEGECQAPTRPVEFFAVAETVEPGDLLTASRDLVGSAELARIQSDRAVIGVVEEMQEQQAAVALAGTVIVKVDADYGPIQVGDLLSSSPTPGHAMRTDWPEPGTVIGKALEPLEAGTGRIRIMVMLH